MDDLPGLAGLVFQWTVSERHDLMTAFMVEVGGYAALDLTVCKLCEHTGHHMLLRYLFARGAVDESLTNSSEERPFHIAARKGDKKTARLLLDCPTSNVDCMDVDGLTPLLGAVVYGHPLLVLLLLSQPNVDVETKVGPKESTPLHLALVPDHWQIVEVLMLMGNPRLDAIWPIRKGVVYVNCFLLAIMARDEAADDLKRLINAGVHYDSGDSAGRSPLAPAAMRGALSTLEVLAEEMFNGYINMDSQDFEGRTPVLHAAEKGHIEACHYLLALGVDIDKPDHKGRSARDWA